MNPTPEERAASATETLHCWCDDCRPLIPQAVAQQIREAVEAERRRVLDLCDDELAHHIDCSVFDLPEQSCDCWVRNLRTAIESGAEEL